MEANPDDTIWGVGLTSSDDAILIESNWRGQNLLGEVLMVVRDIFEKDGESLTKRYERIKTPLGNHRITSPNNN